MNDERAFPFPPSISSAVGCCAVLQLDSNGLRRPTKQLPRPGRTLAQRQRPHQRIRRQRRCNPRDVPMRRV